MERSVLMRYFHTTDAAEAILREGFRPGEGRYGLAGATLRGVFLADQPVNVNEGATGDQVLAVDLSVPIDHYELVTANAPEGGCREWCVPADLINANGTVALLSED